nr:ATP-binding cassette domain-containing protein [uncultured Draconibacterium sp.]
MSTESVIEIRNLIKSFNGTRILKGIDLDLMHGENIAILGQSGTGKSVLTKCIVGLIEADSGTISVLGKELSSIGFEEMEELRKKNWLPVSGRGIIRFDDSAGKSRISDSQNTNAKAK